MRRQSSSKTLWNSRSSSPLRTYNILDPSLFSITSPIYTAYFARSPTAASCLLLLNIVIRSTRSAHHGQAHFYDRHTHQAAERSSSTWTSSPYPACACTDISGARRVMSLRSKLHLVKSIVENYLKVLGPVFLREVLQANMIRSLQLKII